MSDPQKEGMSVKEMEAFAKKHRFELFLCIAFLLACFFNFVFFTFWNIVLATAGGVIGVLLGEKVEKIIHKMMSFIAKQEKLTQLILAIAGFIFAIFLPFVIFAVMGAAGGRYLEQVGSSYRHKE